MWILHGQISALPPKSRLQGYWSVSGARIYAPINKKVYSAQGFIERSFPHDSTRSIEMKIFIQLISMFIAGVGLLEFVKPGSFRDLSLKFDNVKGMYGAAIFRILFGGALIYASPETSFPGFVRILGAFLLLAGFVLLFMSYKRFHEILHWWRSQSPAFFRGFALFALLLGGFLAYAV